MQKNEKGFVEVLGALVVFLIIFGLLFMLFFVSFKGSNEVVSGVVYNTTHDKWLSGNSGFSIRASEDTYVSEENKSSYCLPPNSEYKELVTRAAEDKTIKVVVEAKKYFAFQAPWTCKDNVTVREVE